MHSTHWKGTDLTQRDTATTNIDSIMSGSLILALGDMILRPAPNTHPAPPPPTA